jgi:hypothetical protein
MYALLDPNEQWAIAQAGLDLLGAHLSRQTRSPSIPHRTLRGTLLKLPAKYEGKVLLRLQVGVSADGIADLRPRSSS